MEETWSIWVITEIRQFAKQTVENHLSRVSIYLEDNPSSSLYHWNISKFSENVPQGYWNNSSNQQLFMNELAAKLDVTNATDWFKVSSRSVLQHGAHAVLRKYNNSLGKLLATLYPEYRNACRQAVANIIAQLKLSKVEDLLRVPALYLVVDKLRLFLRTRVPPCPTAVKTTRTLCLQMYVRQHPFVINLVLSTCFPELHVPVAVSPRYAQYRGYWANVNNQRSFLQSIATKLHILCPRVG